MTSRCDCELLTPAQALTQQYYNRPTSGAQLVTPLYTMYNAWHKQDKVQNCNWQSLFFLTANWKYCSVDATLLYFALFCSKMQGLATADLAHGNRELSLYLVADRKFV
jgi:hypothetical protein